MASKKHTTDKEISIGFDADGVLFDTESFQLDSKSVSYMKKAFDLDIKNPDGYGIQDIFECDSETEMKFWSRFVFRYSLFFRARPWVKETISKLRKDGHQVYIVTSKACSLEKSYKRIAVRFLFNLSLKLNGICVDGIEYCSIPNGAQDKLNACRKHEISIMVEDKKENIEALNEHLHILCFETRNNKNATTGNTIRVQDFNEVFFNIQRLVGLTTSLRNTFTKYPLKSKSEKANMSVDERIEYNEWLRKCYSLLPLNAKRIYKAESRMRFLSRIYSPIFDRKYHPVIKGIQNIPDEKGLIFVCNHLCDKDMLLLFSALYPKGIVWHPLIKKEILNEKVGLAFRCAYSVFVDRENKSSRHSATQEMAKLLTNGFNILIFPEGTYNRTENLLKNFTGVSHVYLSQTLQRPIVNCALTKDYKRGPVLRFDKPYVVPKDMSIDVAAKDSFARLEELVKQNL